MSSNYLGRWFACRWSLYELIALFLGVVAGFVKGIVRWILAVLVTLFAVMRLEKVSYITLEMHGHK